MAGNVDEVTVVKTAHGCTKFLTTGGLDHTDVVFSVLTEGDGNAMGTDVEIQVVELHVDKYLSRGQYQLSFDDGTSTVDTVCIEWDAPAAVFAQKLADLSNLDYVHVVRKGEGSILDDYLFRYEIYFNGNGVYRLDDGDLEKLSSTVGAAGGCEDFQTEEFNVYISAGVNGAVVVQDEDDMSCTLCDHGGIYIDATVLVSTDLKAELEKKNCRILTR